MIDGVMEWFQNVMRLCTTTLVKIVILPKVQAVKPFPEEEIEEYLNELF